MLKAFQIVLCAVALLTPACSLCAQQEYFTNWPKGADPQEVGKKLAEHLVTSAHQYGRVHYSEVGAWYGALEFARKSGDADLRERLIRRLDPFMPGGAQTSLVWRHPHVDDEIFGIVPLEVSLLNHDAAARQYGLSFADHQWENPQADGLSSETRYWIDDMYMLTILQVQAYRATGDKKYLDRDAAEMVAYLDKLQQPGGLFFHAPEVPFYWGRGNGWVAAGMAEILRDLPADHPRRARILDAYRKMMAALLKAQARDGSWRQLVDHEESWPESSATAMFTFALVTGVKNGWLDAATYGPAARRGWIALAGYIDQNADVVNVCVGTGRNNSYTYYMTRPRATGDFHGQAPAIWAAEALLPEEKK